MRKKYRLFAYLIVMLAVMLVGGFLYGNVESEVYAQGMFSWEEEVYELPNRASFYGTLESLGINEVYQCISDEKLYTDETRSFVQEMNQTDIDLYYLTGNREWGLEKRGQSMIAEVNKVVAYNKTSKDLGKFKGIIFDVEPYLTEEWDENPKDVMEKYIKNLKRAYDEALEEELYMIVCIPSWFDKSYEGELMQLISENCDEVAIMNYDRKNEMANIEKEIAIAKEYEKAVNCIFEFQRPGKHGLEENQTYYEIGLEKARENFKKIYDANHYKKLKFSYHYYLPIKEIMERD